MFIKVASDKIKGFSDLVGHTIIKIEGDKGNDELVLTLSDGEKYKLYHNQDCCESVYLEDVIGVFDDILNTPIIKAEEVSNADEPAPESEYQPDSYTWTFYHLVTFKGAVTLRWLGESNGYYSESVDLAHFKDDCWRNVAYGN